MTRLQKKKWMVKMVARLGSEAAVREEMKRRQQMSMEARLRKDIPHRGGFSDKELAKKAGELGRQTRWGTSSTESSGD